MLQYIKQWHIHFLIQCINTDNPTYKTTLFHPVTIGVKVANEDDVDDDIKGVKAMSYDLYDESQKF